MRTGTDYWFSKALALCYAEPELAKRRMKRFKAERGISALVAKLQARPEKFGRRASVHESPDRQKEAKQAATLLPLLAMTALQATEIKERANPGMANAA